MSHEGRILWTLLYPTVGNSTNTTWTCSRYLMVNVHRVLNGWSSNNTNEPIKCSSDAISRWPTSLCTDFRAEVKWRRAVSELRTGCLPACLPGWLVGRPALAEVSAGCPLPTPSQRGLSEHRAWPKWRCNIQSLDNEPPDSWLYMVLAHAQMQDQNAATATQCHFHVDILKSAS